MPRATPLAVRADPERPYLYVAQKEAGFAVVSLSSGRATPSLKATLPITAMGGLHVMNLRLDGHRVLLALGDHFDARGSKYGLAIVDLATPEQPKVTHLWVSSEIGRGASDALFAGSYFLAAMDHGVIELKLDGDQLIEKRRIVPDQNFPTPNPNAIRRPNARGLAFDPAIGLMVAYDAGGFRVIREGTEVGRYANLKMGKKPQAYNSVVTEGNVAFAAVDYAGLEVLDLSDPSKPTQLGWWNPWRAESLGNNWFNSPGHTNHIAHDPEGHRVYLSAGDSELQIVDVSDPRRPRPLAGFGRVKDGKGAWGLEVARRTAYLTYIKSAIPFRGTWSGIRAIRLR